MSAVSAVLARLSAGKHSLQHALASTEGQGGYLYLVISTMGPSPRRGTRPPNAPRTGITGSLVQLGPAWSLSQIDPQRRSVALSNGAGPD